MGYTLVPHWVDTLGLVAGGLGVSIAVWLQLVTPRRIRSRYVTAFLALGSALILINLGPVVEGPFLVVAARTAAYISLIVAQTYLGYRVWSKAEVHPIEDTRELLHQ